MKPLLSICVPTFNRAEMLFNLLECLVAEITPFKDEVELIISDNCSTDHTTEVIEQMSKRIKIQYNRNSENLGPGFNIKLLVEKLNTGEFCWIFSDDDILRKGSIKKILKVIKMHPHLDYIFMNTSLERDRSRIKEIFNHDLISQIVYWPTEDCILEKWEETIRMTEVLYPVTQLPCYIFRRSQWQTLSISDYKFCSSFESTYPHIAGLIPEMVGKPCYYIGHPYVGFFLGAQDWGHIWWPKILVVYTLELSNQLKKFGVSKDLIDKYRNMIFRNAIPAFWDVMAKRKPGRESFSLKAMLKRYYKYPEFWRMIFIYPLSRRMHNIFRTLEILRIKYINYTEDSLNFIKNTLNRNPF